MKRLTRALAGSAAAGLAVTGLIGLLHLPFAAALLRAIGPASMCPLTRGTPAQIERAHDLGAASIRASATRAAPSRPALGFVLDQTRRAEVDAWAERHHLSCSSIAGNETLRKCRSVPAAALGQDASLPAVEEIAFEFRESGELVNVQTTRRGLSAEEAARTADRLELTSAALLGRPSTEGGTPTPEALHGGLMSGYVAEHVFTDYRATISATNLASTGSMVREQYLSTRTKTL